jgi:hypothetical protein
MTGLRYVRDVARGRRVSDQGVGSPHHLSLLPAKRKANPLFPEVSDAAGNGGMRYTRRRADSDRAGSIAGASM